MNVGWLAVLDRTQRLILWVGLALVSLAVVGTQVAHTPAHVRFFDNVHWTSGYAAGALLAFTGWRKRRASASRWFTFATASYLVGQLLWDVQVAVGWNPFPGPSDVFFSALGPGLIVAFVSQLRGLPRSTQWMAGLDLVAFSAAALAFTLALYLPLRGSTGLPVTVTLVAYPVFLFTALGAGVVLVLVRRWRLTPGVALLLAAVLADALIWSDWNLRTLRGTLGDGIALNFVFSYAAIALGTGAALWEPLPVERPGTDLLYYALANSIPVLLALGAGIALQQSPLLPASVGPWVQWCSLLVVTAALARQSLALAEREQRLAAERRARCLADQYRDVLARQHEAQRLESLGTLAAGVAHDFNNLLMAIRGHVDLARHDAAEAPASWDAIAKACDRGAEVVHSMMAFGRRQTGSQVRLVLIAAAVQESLRLLRAVIPSSVAFDTELDPAAPAILADPAQLQQILMNLSSNSAHAIGPTPGRITIRASGRRLEADNVEGLPAGEYAQLIVSDTGRGMDEATRRRIFEPFFTTKGADEGSGMGLAVVHGIVTGAGGAVHCESAPDRGATFTILWPRASEEGARSEASRPVPASVALPRGAEVLVVDDEEDITRAVGRYLGKQGLRVTTCNNPVEALRLVQVDPSRFAAVVCDLTMPEMRGDTLCAAIAEIAPRTRIVLSSGTDTPLATDAPGVSATLLKPYRLADLAGLLARLLADEKV
jgi:signal transduction histidine kinase